MSDSKNVQAIVIRLKCGRSLLEKCLRIGKLSKKPSLNRVCLLPYANICVFFCFGPLAETISKWSRSSPSHALSLFSSGQFTYARSQWMQNIKKNIIPREWTQKCETSKYIEGNPWDSRNSNSFLFSIFPLCDFIQLHF